ncbi:conserved hypothetical integral membrane protein [Amycolatopsis marina]|uniref:Conserved hypothetical integral membrane protein n=1 Tax=Amycolatopsis marina TaxID=490629 RepID=A0A1I0X1S8_9PSEU|nr:putative sulfate exporter family transporter [Amycolatopsis marina]SFA94316.1 conserved hypothetical integral membrane protein [Amycolatopsis marina]
MATTEDGTGSVPATGSAAGTGRPRQLLPGLALVVVGVTVAFLVNLAVPALSALTIAVVLGVVVGNLRFVPDSTGAGVRWATRRLLRGGVVLLGLQLAVPHILQLGAGTILAVVLTVAISFLGTLGLGRLLRVPHGLSVLVATGFSICGASAIAAMEGVVKRKESDVATAVALVTLYGSLAIIAVPLFGPMLGFTGAGLGEWAGMSVHEVAQVVAAASPAGAAAVATATVVKLSRVVLLAPMVAAVSVAERRGTPADSGTRPPLVPLFVLGFLAMVALRTVDVLPLAVLNIAGTLTTLLLAGALFGLGCAVRLRSLIHTGPRALLLGLFSTLLVAGVALMTLRLLT